MNLPITYHFWIDLSKESRFEISRETGFESAGVKTINKDSNPNVGASLKVKF